MAVEQPVEYLTAIIESTLGFSCFSFLYIHSDCISWEPCLLHFIYCSIHMQCNDLLQDFTIICYSKTISFLSSLCSDKATFCCLAMLYCLCTWCNLVMCNLAHMRLIYFTVCILIFRCRYIFITSFSRRSYNHGVNSVLPVSSYLSFNQR